MLVDNGHRIIDCDVSLKGKGSKISGFHMNVINLNKAAKRQIKLTFFLNGTERYKLLVD